MTYGEALQILGLSDGFTEEDLRRAYRKKAKQYHPDVAGPGGVEMFQKVKTAYDFLLSFRLENAKSLLTHETIFDVGLKVSN